MQNSNRKQPEKKGHASDLARHWLYLDHYRPAAGLWVDAGLRPPIIATGKVPYQLLGYVHFPDWVFNYRILAEIAIFIGSLNNLWMNIITFFVMMLLLTAIASLLYSMIYSLVGPARYTEAGCPAIKI